MRALLVALLALGPAAGAQSIATDRPDFTESTEVVPLDRVQIEAGATVEWTDDAATAGGPELLLRWSPLSRFEVRLEAPDYTDAGGGGLGDAAAGVKVQLGPTSGVGLAAIGMLTIPVGDSAHGAGGLDPSLIVTASHDVPGGLGLGVQTGAAWLTADDRVDVSLTIVAGVDLTERAGSFLELAVADLAGEPGLVLHHGYTLALGPDAQLDAHGGIGLTAGAPDAFVGVGFALRR